MVLNSIHKVGCTGGGVWGSSLWSLLLETRTSWCLTTSHIRQLPFTLRRKGLEGNTKYKEKTTKELIFIALCMKISTWKIFFLHLRDHYCEEFKSNKMFKIKSFLVEYYLNGYIGLQNKLLRIFGWFTEVHYEFLVSLYIIFLL